MSHFEWSARLDFLKTWRRGVCRADVLGRLIEVIRRAGFALWTSSVERHHWIRLTNLLWYRLFISWNVSWESSDARWRLRVFFLSGILLLSHKLLHNWLRLFLCVKDQFWGGGHLEEKLAFLCNQSVDSHLHKSSKQLADCEIAHNAMYVKPILFVGKRISYLLKKRQF